MYKKFQINKVHSVSKHNAMVSAIYLVFYDKKIRKIYTHRVQKNVQTRDEKCYPLVLPSDHVKCEIVGLNNSKHVYLV